MALVTASRVSFNSGEERVCSERIDFVISSHYKTKVFNVEEHRTCWCIEFCILVRALLVEG